MIFQVDFCVSKSFFVPHSFVCLSLMFVRFWGDYNVKLTASQMLKNARGKLDAFRSKLDSNGLQLAMHFKEKLGNALDILCRSALAALSGSSLSSERRFMPFFVV